MLRQENKLFSLINVSKIINNKIIVIFITPLLLGLTTVFLFQPFNVFFINFIVYRCYLLFYVM